MSCWFAWLYTCDLLKWSVMQTECLESPAEINQRSMDQKTKLQGNRSLVTSSLRLAVYFFGKLNDSLSRMYLHFMYFICFLSADWNGKDKINEKRCFLYFYSLVSLFIMQFHTLSYFVFSTSDKEHTWAVHIHKTTNSKDVDLLFLNLNPDLLHCIILCVLETFWGVPLEVVSACQRS